MCLKPSADTPLPRHVQVGIDLVDYDDPRGGNRGHAVAHLEMQVAIAVVNLLDQVDDEGRDTSVPVAHFPQREAVSTGDHP